MAKMAEKHLKELLREEQEPFYLKDYIAERQCLLKNQASRAHIQLKQPKPTSKSKIFSSKNVFLFSLQHSPDLRKSPLFEFRSPCLSPNRVFLQVPAKTAALLLEAALRIQKPKSRVKNSSFGLFGSVLKRLTNRNRAPKLRASETEDKQTVRKNREMGTEIFVGVNEKEATVSSSSSSSSSSSNSGSCYSSSCNGRQSSLDLESSSSGRSFEDEEKEDGFVFANRARENGGSLSPFRFALHKSPNTPPGFRSPVFSSPATSPSRRITITQDNTEYDSNNSINVEGEEDEHNSPVSVLDPPFEDDVFDIESSYTFVQRAKQQLLHKLHRFEKLAELDPIELEKLINEGDDEYEEQLAWNGEEGSEQDNKYGYDCLTFEEQRRVDQLVDSMVKKYRFQEMKKRGFRRLVCDLIIEERSGRESVFGDKDEEIGKKVSMRLESWKEVESNTIDMMFAMDLKRQTYNWNNAHYAHGDQIDESTIDIEVAIFGILVQELVEDMSNCC